ncbi:MAG: hypothetical protein V4515_01345 [Chloroflexota bacterium]
MTGRRQSGRRQSGRRPVRLAALVVVAAVVGGGCGAEATAQPTVAVSGTPLPTPVTTTYPLGARAWYAGLVIYLDSALSVIDAGGGYVTVDIRLENPGEDLASLGVPILLASGGTAVEPVRGTIVPDVPGGSSVGTTIQFDVNGAFELARSAIRIGRAAEHVVVVPLVAGSQDRVTLDPLALSLSGSASAGALAVTLTGGELRADLPDWGLELARGTLALTVNYTARYKGDFVGGFAFTGANIGLRLPDGTVIAARPDGHSQSVAVLEPAKSVPNLLARFDVPAPGSGTYALIVKDGSSSAAIPFTVDGVGPGG